MNRRRHGEVVRGPSSHRRARSRSDFVIVAALLVALVVGTAIAVVVLAPESRADYRVTQTVALDHMSRTVDAGWGTPELGGSYSLSLPGAFGVTAGSGTIALSASTPTASATTSAVTSADSLATVKVAVNELPSDDASMSIGLALRSGAGGSYRASVVVLAGGATRLAIERFDAASGTSSSLGTALLPYRVTADEKIELEFRVVGEAKVDLTARAWLDDGATNAVELAASDSSAARLAMAGSAGIWAAMANGRAAAVTVDDFAVFDVVRAKHDIKPSMAFAAGSFFSGRRSDVGAAAVGTAQYVVPFGALFVAPDGSDTADGTEVTPFRTVRAAVRESHPGMTIVVRGGSYHESITVSEGRAVTIQAFPGEAVWLDGSSTVTGWTYDAGVWKRSGWTTFFDSSATYTSGAADGTDAGWRFVSDKYPMAAHPDQLWVDGVAQRQVATKSDLVPGTFFVDEQNKALYLGSNPERAVVRASTLQKAIDVTSDDTTLRGVGIRRYAPSVPQLGAVVLEGARNVLDNVEIDGSATTGLFVTDTGSTVSRVTITNSGLVGLSASQADGLTVDSLDSERNNTESFNLAPVSGGVKITKSRHVVVKDSTLSNNFGQGLWFDESVYDGSAVGNTVSNNVGHGLIVEISAQFTIANNVIDSNGKNGIKINNASDVEIWNNDLSGNDREINIVQDSRRGADASVPGHDSRRPFPDPTMPWTTGPVTVRNNVLKDTVGNCLLCVEDFSKKSTAAQLGVTAGGDVFGRDSTTSPTWLVVWSRGAAPNPAVYTSLAAFSAATGQDTTGIEATGSGNLVGSPTSQSRLDAASASHAVPLTSQIADAIGRPAGTKHLGSWHD